MTKAEKIRSLKIKENKIKLYEDKFMPNNINLGKKKKSTLTEINRCHIW